jgi:exodeoxyribonuclease VII small subunit
MENKKFEDKMKELENMVLFLESGKAGLEESIKIVTNANTLIKEMEKELSDTENKLKVLNMNTNSIKNIAEDDNDEF